MIELDNYLDVILEEETTTEQRWELLDTATQLHQTLQQTQQQISDISYKLVAIKNKMNADLAVSIRRAQPALNVSVDKNFCKVGYKTKLFNFTPDIDGGVWKVSSPNRRFLHEFLKAHRRDLFLTSDLSILITAIISYFSAYYRTLGEDIVGTGLLLVDGNRTSLCGVLEWANEDRTPLRSRRKAKCPKCGATEHDGLLPTDFESVHCSKCGKTYQLSEATFKKQSNTPLYHATHINNVKHILAKGLDPALSGYADEEKEDAEYEGWEPPHHFVYLTPSLNVARGFGPGGDLHKDPNRAVFEVSLPPALRRRLITNRGEFERAPFVIPPQFIKRIE